MKEGTERVREGMKAQKCEREEVKKNWGRGGKGYRLSRFSLSFQISILCMEIIGILFYCWIFLLLIQNLLNR